MDYMIPKPERLRGYPLHRMVADLAKGRKVQFVDQGSHVRLRTTTKLEATPANVREVVLGSVVAFELTACVGLKCHGRHRYFKPNDWRSRHSWLEKKGEQLGFELLALHCDAGQLHIEDGARNFKMDKTKFTGVLKVTNLDLFELALKEGVGNTGRAFGMGMLII